MLTPPSPQLTAGPTRAGRFQPQRLVAQLPERADDIVPCRNPSAPQRQQAPGSPPLPYCRHDEKLQRPLW